MVGLKDLKIPLFALIFVLIGLFLYSKIFGPIPLSVNNLNTNKTDLFQTTGKGEAAGIPNTAVVNLGVTSEALTVEGAQERTNRSSSAIINELKKLGVEEKNIKTTNYSINPNYTFGLGPQRISGYNVTQNLEIKIKPVDKANQVIDVAVNNGANLVGGINFILDEKSKAELEEQALKEAVSKARSKANLLASTTGIKLGKIINVEQILEDSPIFPFEARATEDDLSAPTQITPGEAKINVTVILTFEVL